MLTVEETTNYLEEESLLPYISFENFIIKQVSVFYVVNLCLKIKPEH